MCFGYFSKICAWVFQQAMRFVTIELIDGTLLLGSAFQQGMCLEIYFSKAQKLCRKESLSKLSPNSSNSELDISRFYTRKCLKKGDLQWYLSAAKDDPDRISAAYYVCALSMQKLSLV
jgi:hypothetical protein